MPVCVLGSIIRTGCLAPYVHSVQGSWENKALHGPRCYCYLPPPRVAFEGRKYKSACGPRGMWQWFILWRPLTSPVHPHMLSHTTPSAQNTRSPEPESEAGPYPSRCNGPSLSPEICLASQWKTDGRCGGD